MKLTKKEVQQRVLQNGKPLELDKFSWDDETSTFSSNENDLIIDFNGIDNCTFKTESGCTFNAGDNCTFKTGFGCTFKTGFGCTFNTWDNCTFDTESGCTFKTGDSCTFRTESECTFATGFGCTFDTLANCTFNTLSGCTFKTGHECTFATGHECTFATGFGCTFKTGANCTFKTWSECTFKTGVQGVIYRRDTQEIIPINGKDTVQLFPYRQKGYLVNGLYNGKPHIIADGIVSEIINKKGNSYKIRILGGNNETFLYEENGVFAHGKTLKEARESLIYKIGDRDTSKYKELTLDSVVTKAEAIKMYRVITGACEYGVRQFVESQQKTNETYSVKEIVELTTGQYGHETFSNFFIGGNQK